MSDVYVEPDGCSLDCHEGAWPECPDCGKRLNGVYREVGAHEIEFLGLDCPLGCLPTYVPCGDDHGEDFFLCAACVMETQIGQTHRENIVKLKRWEKLATTHADRRSREKR